MIKKLNLSSLDEMVNQPIDIFICCGSFEVRCLSIATHIDLQKIEKAFVAENMNLESIVDHNSQRLRNLFKEKAVPVPIDSGDPIKTADTFMSVLKQYRNMNGTRYLIDITTFTHESLLILIRILKQYSHPRDRINFIYNRASKYSKDKHEEKWLSKGISAVRSVLGYPGDFMPSRNTHLIILVGYEHERASKLIEVYEPNALSLGYGKAGSQTSDEGHEVNRYFHKLLADACCSYVNVNTFEFTSNDPWNTKEAILKQKNSFNEFNTVVAPMNTKISTLGCALASIFDEAIQLCYAQANQYNYEEYSVPGDSCYLFDLPELFGS